MTHEYVIAVNGQVEPSTLEDGEGTAVGWAAEAVLAVGPDDVVRAISRGDSVFLDLCGCVVTPLPDGPSQADSLIRENHTRGPDVARVLVECGLLPADATIEPGAPADLAFWGSDGLVAIVRGGRFIDGDEHRGPFPPAASG